MLKAVEKGIETAEMSVERMVDKTADLMVDLTALQMVDSMDEKTAAEWVNWKENLKAAQLESLLVL